MVIVAELTPSHFSPRHLHDYCIWRARKLWHGIICVVLQPVGYSTFGASLAELQSILLACQMPRPPHKNNTVPLVYTQLS